jgi:hypothetical protein
VSRAARIGLAGLLGLSACAGESDPPWQLDHDRIVAVRATPPGLAAGDRATLDALLAAKGGKTSVAVPELATVVSPASLAGALGFSGGAWVVTAPSEAQLAAARAELKLDPGAPVPLVVGVSYASGALVATKAIALGAPAPNPTLTSVMLDARPAGTAELVIGKLVDVPLAIDVDDEDYDVTWLTSCGTMHDFDLPRAYLTVEADDPVAGELAVVLRDAKGGVAWNVWPIRAE